MGKKADALQEHLETAERELATSRDENSRLRAEVVRLREAGRDISPNRRIPPQTLPDDMFDNRAGDRLARSRAAVAVDTQFRTSAGHERTCPICSNGELDGVVEGKAEYNCGHWGGAGDDEPERQIVDNHGMIPTTAAAGTSALRVVLDAGGNPINTVMSSEDRQYARLIAKTLGLGDDADDLASIAAALEQLHQGRVDPAMVKDTFAESVEHNRKERSQLYDDLVATRAIVSRVAAALQVGDWNKQTGDELVERAQRYQGLTHWLKKRAGEHGKLRVGHGVTVDRIVADALFAEVNTIITLMVAPTELAKWVAKQAAIRPVSEAVTSAVQDGTYNLPGAPGAKAALPLEGELLQTVKEWWRCAVESTLCDHARTRASDPAVRLFGPLLHTPLVAREFMEYVNVVIMPMLAKYAPPDSVIGGVP